MVHQTTPFSTEGTGVRTIVTALTGTDGVKAVADPLAHRHVDLDERHVTQLPGADAEWQRIFASRAFTAGITERTLCRSRCIGLWAEGGALLTVTLRHDADSGKVVEVLDEIHGAPTEAGCLWQAPLGDVRHHRR